MENSKLPDNSFPRLDAIAAPVYRSLKIWLAEAARDGHNNAVIASSPDRLAIAIPPFKAAAKQLGIKAEITPARDGHAVAIIASRTDMQRLTELARKSRTELRRIARGTDVHP